MNDSIRQLSQQMPRYFNCGCLCEVNWQQKRLFSTKNSNLIAQKEGIMKISQYVSVEEVKRVCQELKISDWTNKKEPKVSVKEAKVCNLPLINAQVDSL